MSAQFTTGQEVGENGWYYHSYDQSDADSYRRASRQLLNDVEGNDCEYYRRQNNDVVARIHILLLLL